MMKEKSSLQNDLVLVSTEIKRLYSKHLVFWCCIGRQMSTSYWVINNTGQVECENLGCSGSLVFDFLVIVVLLQYKT